MGIVIWPPVEETWVEAIRAASGGLPVAAPADEVAARDEAVDATGWIGRLTPALLAAAPGLRWLQATSISLERVVFPELAASNVTLTNMRNIYNDHIANHVLAMLLALCRDMPRLMRRQASATWMSEPEVAIRDPGEMTLLILGLGGIGAEVARRAAVFGFSIIGVDPQIPTAPEGVRELARPDRLPDLLGSADAVIVCAPHTPETEGMFDDALFARMKRGALFINIGRGVIVRLDALVRALHTGRVGGAGLDVFETEPLPAGHPLWAMENVIVTPHSAGYGPHTANRRLAVITDNVRRFVAGEPLHNIADISRWY